MTELLPLEGATNKVWEQGKFAAPDKKGAWPTAS